MLKKTLRKILPNPFDRLLKQAKAIKSKKILLVWNRGLGDIPLGLYAIVTRIREILPSSEITFLTRPDLLEGFSLLEGVKTYSSSLLIRNRPIDLFAATKDANLDPKEFDVIIEKPDPTYWVRWQIGKLQPKLLWKKEWDLLAPALNYPEKKKCIGVHIHSETSYGYEKNWPFEKWDHLFSELEAKGFFCFLFGKKANTTFHQKNLIDLRGKTSLLELLSLLKNHCSFFIGPDSGILSLLYYINAPYELKLISLWADPNQGVLKQNVLSPNPLLIHVPLIAKNRDLSLLEVEEVMKLL